jgi:Domain of unknown function (DUF3291)
MRWHLAQVNLAVAVAPADDPVMADFVALLGPLDELARAAPGFVSRPSPGELDRADLAVFGDSDRTVVNWTVWSSLEAFRAFTYGPAHLAAMRRFRHCFLPATAAHLALWWIEAGQEITPAMAYDRLSRLRADGPSPSSFTLDAPHPPPSTDQRPGASAG